MRKWRFFLLPGGRGVVGIAGSLFVCGWGREELPLGKNESGSLLRKRKAAVFCGAALGLAVFFGAGAAFALTVIADGYPAGMTRGAAGSAEPVLLGEAIEAAFLDAGISGRDATVTNAKRISNHGIFVYRVEFCAGDTEFVYEIFEDSGTVYSKSQKTVVAQKEGTVVQPDADGDVSGAGTGEEALGSGGQPDAEGNLAGSGAEPDAARDSAGAGVQDAFSDSNVSGAGQDSSGSGGQSGAGQEVSGSGGQPGTVGDASLGNGEGEAGSGQNAGQPGMAQQSGSGSDIGLEQAKAIALSHAGCTSQEVQFSKAKFEKEHGSIFYEIEFYKDGMEYEYTIHAVTGEILEFETEMDD